MINTTATVHVEVNGMEELLDKLEKMSALAIELKALIEETNQIKLTATGQVLSDE